MGHIILEAKQTGERSAGNPHAAFDEAGAGNVARPRWCDTAEKERATGNTNLAKRRVSLDYTDEIVNDQRLTRLERLPWHGAWISSERSVPHDTRAPTQACYDEEISQGRTMLQNLSVINANATGSLHSGKLQ